MPHDHHSIAPKLTKNEKLVFEQMQGSDKPQKAYDLLDVLKNQGIRAPMTIYRALEGLEEKGLVHKLDALNAYVRCNHDQPHAVETFLVCDVCNDVEEIETAVADAPSVEANIQAVVREKKFTMEAARLEIRGTCPKCTTSEG